MISSLHIFREGNSRQGVDDLLSISVKFAMKLGVKRCIDVERMFSARGLRGTEDCFFRCKRGLDVDGDARHQGAFNSS